MDWVGLFLDVDKNGEITFIHYYTLTVGFSVVPQAPGAGQFVHSNPRESPTNLSTGADRI